jgi:hypothetical protein
MTSFIDIYLTNLTNSTNSIDSIDLLLNQTIFMLNDIYVK